ncbi:MAG: ABC transporter ATP-binding protein [Rhizobiaceae bacterium]
MTSLTLEDVFVEFPLYGSRRSLRKVLFERATGGLITRQKDHENRIVIKALNGVSLHLQDGDRIGLVGHNGAGKTTMLRVMAGVYEPIGGRVFAEGQITPLFDFMPGLDMEDSGYENIITAGLLLGMSRKEIEARIPEIEEFSELGEYLSLPVRTYSSGMTTRLSFSVVTSLDPGILLMDEGIGAGDARFAKRAAERANEFINRSRIVVLASHADGLIRSICNKAALMHQGKIVALGAVDEVLEQYGVIARGGPPPAPAT